MNAQDAANIINRYAPCPHPNIKVVGNGLVYCEDCCLTFSRDNLDKYIKASKDFDAAINYILSIDKELKKNSYRNVVIKEYMAIDIETTGLSLHSQVLQLAAIHVDGDAIEKFNCLIDNSEHDYLGPLEPYALAMNSWIFDAIARRTETSIPILSRNEAIKEFNLFCENLVQHKNKPIVLAGKNVAGFDLPILRNNGFDINVKHRIIDVGSMYYPFFGYVPSFDEISALIGAPPITHNAMEDCERVVEAIQWMMKI